MMRSGALAVSGRQHFKVYTVEDILFGIQPIAYFAQVQQSTRQIGA